MMRRVVALCSDIHMEPMRPQVHGAEVDKETRCAHYHSPLDITAIKDGLLRRVLCLQRLP
jgi:hypothetical protein